MTFWYIVLGVVYGLLGGFLIGSYSKGSEVKSLQNQLAGASSQIEHLERRLTATEEVCVTGSYLAEDGALKGSMRIGEVQLCGRGLRWTAIYGPDLTTAIENREAEIMELKSRLKELSK